jgi:Uma2 family endonuclease
MITKLKPYTIADWDAMPADDGYRYEIIEGELFVSCSPGLTHQRVALDLAILISKFLERTPIGELVPTPGVVLSEYSGVIPDLVVFLNEQAKTIVTGERLTGPPDLVVEILSPGSANVRRDRVAKLQLYSKHGVREYWIVDPKNRTVEQYVTQGSSLNLLETLHAEDILSTAVLPGFSCPLSQIFGRI